MQKHTVILYRVIPLIILIWSVTSCSNNKCYQCEFYYRTGPFFNPTNNDSISLSIISNNYGLDTIEKYYQLGYIQYDYGAEKYVQETICPEDFNRLKKSGINYNCYLE